MLLLGEDWYMLYNYSPHHHPLFYDWQIVQMLLIIHLHLSGLLLRFQMSLPNSLPSNKERH